MDSLKERGLTAVTLNIEKKITYEKTKFGGTRLKPPKGMSYTVAYEMNLLRRDTSPLAPDISLEELNAYYSQLEKEGKWQFDPAVTKTRVKTHKQLGNSAAVKKN